MRLLIALVTIAIVHSAQAQHRALVFPLAVHDGEGHSAMLTCGLQDSATAGFDGWLKEVPIPPIPAAPTLDVRFVDPFRRKGIFAGLDSYVDIRGLQSHEQVESLYVRYRPANESYPVVFSWPTSIGEKFGDARLIYRSQDSLLVLDMRRKESLSLGSDAGNLLILILGKPSPAINKPD